MKKKKLLALLMVVSMMATMFIGCRSKEEVVPDTSETTQDTTQTADTTDEGAVAVTDEEITITMMVSGTSTENDLETEIIPKFIKEKFPNITLEVTKLPDDQYYTALKTKLASGECPDIILVQPKNAGSNSVIGLAKAGYLLDLSDLNAVALQGESASAALSYDGSVYGIAEGVSILGTYYNKDMFEANGLAVPTNWEEFLNCCEVLKTAGIQPIVMGDKDAYVMQFGLYQLAANVVYPQNAAFDDQLADGTTKFTDEGIWDTVLGMYSELYEKGYVIDSSLGLGASQAIQKFIDGEAAMTFDGSFNLTAIKAEGATAFERGYFPLPGNSVAGEIYSAMAPSAGPAIYAETSYPDECKAILEYWFDGESDLYKAYADSGKAIVTYGYGADKNDELFVPFLDMYNAGKAFYWSNQAWPAGTESEMTALFGELIGGQGTTVDDIVKAMQMKFEELYTE